MQGVRRRMAIPSLDQIHLTHITAYDIIISCFDITYHVVGKEIKSMGEQKGALTEGIYYILLSLVKPLHGYGIMQNVEALTGGRLKLAAGTLYGAIVNMIEKGWIKALPVKKNSRKKEYIITEAGKSVLKDEIRRLEELLQNGNKIFEEPMQ